MREKEGLCLVLFDIRVQKSTERTTTLLIFIIIILR